MVVLVMVVGSLWFAAPATPTTTVIFGCLLHVPVLESTHKYFLQRSGLDNRHSIDFSIFLIRRFVVVVVVFGLSFCSTVLIRSNSGYAYNRSFLFLKRYYDDDRSFFLWEGEWDVVHNKHLLPYKSAFPCFLAMFCPYKKLKTSLLCLKGESFDELVYLL